MGLKQVRDGNNFEFIWEWVKYCTLFVFNSFNYFFRNKSFIKEWFNTFFHKPFSGAIFFENIFNFSFYFKFQGKTKRVYNLIRI